MIYVIFYDKVIIPLYRRRTLRPTWWHSSPWRSWGTWGQSWWWRGLATRSTSGWEQQTWRRRMSGSGSQEDESAPTSGSRESQTMRVDTNNDFNVVFQHLPPQGAENTVPCSTITNWAMCIATVGKCSFAKWEPSEMDSSASWTWLITSITWKRTSLTWRLTWLSCGKI